MPTALSHYGVGLLVQFLVREAGSLSCKKTNFLGGGCGGLHGKIRGGAIIA